jgi:hypothetical protein
MYVVLDEGEGLIMQPGHYATRKYELVDRDDDYIHPLMQGYVRFFIGKDK